MGQGQSVLMQAVMRAEELAAASGLNRVHGIAGYGVIRLGEQCLVIGEYQSLKAGTCPDGFLHVVQGNPRGGAGGTVALTSAL
jgi:hypothetical protein